MKTTRVSSIILALLFIIVSSGMADDFSCGSYIISVGDRQYDILRKCGNPAYADSHEELRIRRDLGSHFFAPGEEPPGAPLFVKVLVTVDEWEYNFGPGKFIRYLTFENGRLVRITTGDYGY